MANLDNKTKITERTGKFRSFNVADETSYVLSAPKLKKERDVSVISDRFGLKGDKPKTLEEIGKSLGITRERVRQIEKNALRKVREFVASDLRGQEIASTLAKIIADNGGSITKKSFDDTLLGDNIKTINRHQTVFLLNICEKINTVHDNEDIKESYFVEPLTISDINSLVKTAVEILETEKNPLPESKLVSKVAEQHSNVDKNTLIAVISLSKKILKTDSGHLGLTHWREINPKSIKDKTYYILKKYKKPLHYTEISKHIQNFDENKRPVTKQAVHNELIRDERFVLIGRGIYALREWGYNSGVVEDVIAEVLLTSNEPMHKDIIITEVLKRRMVKETTILLNLQKPRFTRVARATYIVTNREG